MGLSCRKRFASSSCLILHLRFLFFSSTQVMQAADKKKATRKPSGRLALDETSRRLEFVPKAALRV
jgi:hypothetical protein